MGLVKPVLYYLVGSRKLQEYQKPERYINTAMRLGYRNSMNEYHSKNFGKACTYSCDFVFKIE